MNDRPESAARPGVLCWGELLWDWFEDGPMPGGAPLNVAARLRRLGIDARVASAVGDDPDGTRLLDAVRRHGLDTEFTPVVTGAVTGRAGIELTADGVPRFEIAGDVAWDRIPVGRSLGTFADSADAIVYGTLAQRGPSNRDRLHRILSRTSALKVIDVNLRRPFDQPQLVLPLVRQADLVKVNDDELFRLLPPSPCVVDLECGARRLSALTGARTVCVTAGPKGAGLLSEDTWYWEESHPTEVIDTVGAGDAFVAGLLAAMLCGSDPATALGLACREAESAVGHRGALPADGWK